jgi:hypothetical protein
MSKIILKITGLLAVFVLLFGGVAQAAQAPASPAGKEGTQQEDTAVAAQPSGETRALVVGGLALVLMVSIAGAVLYYTARGRHSAE